MPTGAVSRVYDGIPILDVLNDRPDDLLGPVRGGVDRDEVDRGMSGHCASSSKDTRHESMMRFNLPDDSDRVLA